MSAAIEKQPLSSEIEFKVPAEQGKSPESGALNVSEQEKATGFTPEKPLAPSESAPSATEHLSSMDDPDVSALMKKIKTPADTETADSATSLEALLNLIDKKD